MNTWNTRARIPKVERNGTIVLLLILLALTALKRPLCSWLADKEEPVKMAAYTPLLQQIETAVAQYNNDQKKGKSFATYKSSPATYTANTGTSQIEVNSASAADWESLYGIGPVLAGRIIKFRDGLGGFQRIDQLRDVYGIKPEVFEQIKPRLRIKPKPFRRININEADVETLMAHPYIPPTLAKQFVGYRDKVRPFESVEDIKNLYYLRDHPDLFDKLSPYLTVN